MSRWLGIDKGRTEIKVALVRSGWRMVSLEAVAVVPLSASSVPSASIAQDSVRAAQDALAHVISSVPTARGGLAYDGIAVAVEGIQAAVLKLALPAQIRRQVAEILPFELEGELPFPLKDAVFDFCSLTGEKAGSTFEVLVGVAPVEQVQQSIDWVEQAVGAQPYLVSVGALSLAHLVPYVPLLLAQEPVAVVDLGRKVSDFLLLVKGEVKVARTFFAGLDEQRGLALLVQQIRISLAGHQAAGGASPCRLVLSGEGCFEQEVIHRLAEGLGLPVETVPMAALACANAPSDPARDLARFAKAIGLALSLRARSGVMNLRQGPLAYEGGFGWLKEKMSEVVAVGVVVALSFLFSSGAQIYAFLRERGALEHELFRATHRLLGESTKDPAHARQLLLSRMSFQDEDPMPHADAFDVMVRLSESIPTSMVHDIEELDVQGGHVLVHGIVGSIPEAQAIASALRKQPCFSHVKIARTSQAVQGDRQKYVLEFEMRCPEDSKKARREEKEGVSFLPLSCKDRGWSCRHG